MKKLLILLSVLTISSSATPTTIAASNYEKKPETNTIVKDSDINNQQKNNLENSNRNKRAISGGKNKYKYRGIYHKIYLNHNVISNIEKIEGAATSIPAIGAAISSAVSGPQVIIAAGAALLAAQWKIWKVGSYDKGDGIIITMGGLLPAWIVKVKAQ